MVTLNNVNQYALENNLGDDTDVFYILSLMQLDVKEKELPAISNSLSLPSPPATDFSTLVEYTTEDLLNLFST